MVLCEKRGNLPRASDVPNCGLFEPRDGCGGCSATVRPGESFGLLQLEIKPSADLRPPGLFGRCELACSPKAERCLEDAEFESSVPVDLVDDKADVQADL